MMGAPPLSALSALRRKLSDGERCIGTFLNLGSSLTAEIASRGGLDWVLLDHEHGPGSEETMLAQLQAVGCGSAAPIIRVAWNDPVRVKRALDLGAAGIMFPYVNHADDAQAAIGSMRYPPAGVRGVSRFNRACAFGAAFDTTFASGGRDLLAVVQIETLEAVDQAPAIAAVEGVDVLFVGPLDLSVNLGIPAQTHAPAFTDACEKVVAAARRHGKAAGILLSSADERTTAAAQGFSLMAIGSDGGFVAAGIRALMAGADRDV